MIVCRFFWYKGPLTWVAKASIQSFLKFPENKVEIYTYDKSKLGAESLVWKDASEILDRGVAEKYLLEMGSYSAASNLFRYQLMYQKGGWYFDTDCILIKSLKPLDQRKALFGFQGHSEPNVAVLKFPPKLQVFLDMYEDCLSIDPSRYVWGMAGPRMFARHIKKEKLESLGLDAPYFYPVSFTEVERLRRRIKFDEKTYILHLWNESLRKRNFKEHSIHPSNLSRSIKEFPLSRVQWFITKMKSRLLRAWKELKQHLFKISPNRT